MAKLYIEIDTQNKEDWDLFKKRQPNGIVLTSDDAIEVTQRLLDEGEEYMISHQEQAAVGVFFDVVDGKVAIARAMGRMGLPEDTQFPLIITSNHCDENEKGN